MDVIAGPQSNQNHYTNAELMAMQQDAIRRVQDMHRRSQQRVQGQQENSHADRSNRSQNTAQPARPARKQEQKPHRPPAPSVPAEPAQGETATPIDKILRDLNIDKDRMILLGLILLLLNEGADRTLIIALVYLLI